MARDRRIQSITCQEILNEFSEKLIQKFTLSEERAEEIIQEVRQFSRIVRINQELALVSADPDDDMIIECAIAGKATHIITGDKHLLLLVEYQNIQPVKAKDFLDFLTRNNNHQLWTLLNVILLQDIPEERLSAGDVGTLIEKHQIEGLERGYSVGFFDRLRKTITVVTMAENSPRFAAPLRTRVKLINHAIF